MVEMAALTGSEVPNVSNPGGGGGSRGNLRRETARKAKQLENARKSKGGTDSRVERRKGNFCAHLPFAVVRTNLGF